MLIVAHSQETIAGFFLAMFSVFVYQIEVEKHLQILQADHTAIVYTGLHKVKKQQKHPLGGECFRRKKYLKKSIYILWRFWLFNSNRMSAGPPCFVCFVIVVCFFKPG